MKKYAYIFLASILLLPTIALAQTNDNTELQSMFREDQNSRNAINIDWASVSKQDSIRQKNVYELLKKGKVITGNDYYHAAMIFQHGEDSTASTMTVSLMKKALQLDTTINKWLLAAAIDRDLMSKNKPQIYGTQYIKMGVNARWKRYKIDTTKVSDEERKYYGVETLSVQKIKENNMNLHSIASYYSTTNSIEKTKALILAEKKKKGELIYNISEEEINSFGYQLMNANSTSEALIIFKLNTELYPDSFNTFDSYGECLIKLGNRAEGLKAYRKSLILNPQNNNAKKILTDNK